MNPRARRFVVVGAAGFLVQLSLVAALTQAQWPAWLATALAVEVAVIVNFMWHEAWTWRDRTCQRHGRLRRLGRFHISNGLGSIAGNVLVTTVLVAGLHAHPVIANMIAVVLMSAGNYVAADRWVFGKPATLAF